MEARILGQLAFLAAISLLLTVLTGTAALAGTPAYDIDGAGTVFSNSPIMVGWEFDVTVPITIDGLGLWDEDADGIVDHEVGIWNSAETLLASTTITAEDSLVASPHASGDWRIAPIPTVSLPVGNGYVIGAHWSAIGDGIRVRSDVGLIVTTIPEISYVQARTRGTATFAFPTNGTTSTNVVQGYAGPTFTVVTAAPSVPGLEAVGLATLALALIALTVIYARARPSPAPPPTR
jgi:hypothetical protein